MSLPEAEAYVRGVQRRYRQQWEQARFMAYCSLRPWSRDLEPSALMRFPWEDESGGKVDEEQEAAAIDALRARIPEYQELIRKMTDGQQ